MNKFELKKYIDIGKVPVSVFSRKTYENINTTVRITKGNKVFLDFDDNYGEEGGMRITFLYNNFDEMLKSIEKYIGTDISSCKVIYDKFEEVCQTQTADWQKLKEAVYNHKILLLENYKSFFIGDLYRKGLFYNEISPISSAEEILDWVRCSENKNF